MRGQSTFKFYGSLKDFFSSKKRHGELCYSFVGKPSIKDAIESLGVPHPEVALILVDDQPASFERPLRCGQDIHVYPPSDTPPCEQRHLLPLRPPEIRFILDVHLGILAKCLRILGFDVIYEPDDMGDARIARIAHEEKRILLTRDIGLLKRSAVVYGYWIRDQSAQQQLREVVARYDIERHQCKPFSRCLTCNDNLISVAKDAVLDRLKPKVRDRYNDFRQCLACERIYWKGSHYRSMKELIDNLWAVPSSG